MKLRKSVRNLAIRSFNQNLYAKIAILFNRFERILSFSGNDKNVDYIEDSSLPLIYISQQARSGGTMMRNLFDGHSALRVYPTELTWQKNGFYWDKELKLSQPKKAYEILYAHGFDRLINSGVDKKYPFVFSQKRFDRLFFSYPRGDDLDTRKWMDVFFTAFFNSWLDYQNIYGVKARYNVAFCPWNTMKVENEKNFFKVYPDGFRVHVIRHPCGWWASEKHYALKGKDLAFYMKRWLDSVQTGIEMAQEFPEKYLLISYDNLIFDTPSSMQSLSNALSLDYEDVLSLPTVNNIPRHSNSSFEKIESKIDSKTKDRWRHKLDKEEIEEVLTLSEEVYLQAISLCVNKKGDV